MAIDREGVVRIAGNRDETESVTAVAIHDDGRERSNWTASIAAFSVDQGGVGSGDESSRGGGSVIPGRAA